MAQDMKHKSGYNAFALLIAADTAEVANRMAEDGEEPLSDTEGRVFAARGLRKQKAAVIASALRVDEDDVRKVLAEMADDAAAEAAEEAAEEAAIAAEIAEAVVDAS